MERFRIRTSTLLMRVAVDEIVYVKADGNYCDLVLINGRSRKMTFQLHHFEDNFKLLKSADMFIRIGRSLIVNRQYVQVIDLIDQTIVFGGKHLTRELRTDNPNAHRPDRNAEVSAGRDIYVVKVSRDALKQLKEQLENMRGGETL
ncbi:MAG: LytTR family transcriptional regulator DNA-binding domain-containing protein [Prevotella sp.]|nr:LytTR family transcriptional regulator DNA-binding domain-containing protein [Prevotella sp.]